MKSKKNDVAKSLRERMILWKTNEIFCTRERGYNHYKVVKNLTNIYKCLEIFHNS